MKYTFYIILTLFAVLAATLVFKYLGKKAPTGPDSSTWALGIVYLVILLAIMGLSLLLFYFKRPGIALAVVLSPVILMVASYIISGSVDIYAYFPSLNPVRQLTIIVKNDSPFPVHLKMDCMFPLFMSNDETIYKTLNYYAEPNSIKKISLSKAETQLLAKKASSVGVYIYQRDSVKADSGYVQYDSSQVAVYMKEMPSAFANGEYLLDINELLQKKGKP